MKTQGTGNTRAATCWPPFSAHFKTLPAPNAAHLEVVGLASGVAAGLARAQQPEVLRGQRGVLGEQHELHAADVGAVDGDLCVGGARGGMAWWWRQRDEELRVARWGCCKGWRWARAWLCRPTCFSQRLVSCPDPGMVCVPVLPGTRCYYPRVRPVSSSRLLIASTPQCLSTLAASPPRSHPHSRPGTRVAAIRPETTSSAAQFRPGAACCTTQQERSGDETRVMVI